MDTFRRMWDGLERRARARGSIDLEALSTEPVRPASWQLHVLAALLAIFLMTLVFVAGLFLTGCAL